MPICIFSSVYQWNQQLETINMEIVFSLKGATEMLIYSCISTGCNCCFSLRALRILHLKSTVKLQSLILSLTALGCIQKPSTYLLISHQTVLFALWEDNPQCKGGLLTPHWEESPTGWSATVVFTSGDWIEREIDRRTGAAAAGMQTLNQSVVVKKELSRKDLFSVHWSIYVPTL